MRWRRAWWIIVAVAAALFPTIVVLTIVRIVPQHREKIAPPNPEAPPDLEMLRVPFVSGIDALRRKDGHEAVRHFSSFSFRGRAVEEYRLYYLAAGHQLSADRVASRIALARLWSRTPRLVYWQEAGFNLGGLYASGGDFRHAADVHSQLSTRSDVSPIAANARWQTLVSRFAAGDIAAVLFTARHIVIKNPRSPQVNAAILIVRSLSGVGPSQAIPLTPAERLERGVSLMRDGDPQHALDELTALQTAGVVPSNLKQAVELNRGLALKLRLRR